MHVGGARFELIPRYGYYGLDSTIAGFYEVVDGESYSLWIWLDLALLVCLVGRVEGFGVVVRNVGGIEYYQGRRCYGRCWYGGS